MHETHRTFDQKKTERRKPSKIWHIKRISSWGSEDPESLGSTYQGKFDFVHFSSSSILCFTFIKFHIYNHWAASMDTQMTTVNIPVLLLDILETKHRV